MGAFSFVWYTFHRMENISVNISDSDESYSINASFNRWKSGRIRHYLREKFHNDIFKKNNVDAYLNMDDHARVHVKTRPGHISIYLDKNNAGFDSYYKLKEVEEEIKKKLTEN